MEVNYNCKFEIEYIGNGKTPIVIVDDFLIDSEILINHAIQQVDFKHAGSNMYPGVRGFLPKEYVFSTLGAIVRTICDVFEVPEHKRLTPLGVNYSLVSIPEEQLSLVQKLPHFDSCSDYHFALLHYLNPKSHGGTGFFRHIETGFERITKSRESRYFKSLEEQIPNIEKNAQGYFTKTSDEFELYHQVEYRPNRLIFYPGSLLHSGLIISESDISDSLVDGRLTANIFIDFQ